MVDDDGDDGGDDRDDGDGDDGDGDDDDGGNNNDDDDGGCGDDDDNELWFFLYPMKPNFNNQSINLLGRRVLIPTGASGRRAHRGILGPDSRVGIWNPHGTRSTNLARPA